MDVADGERAPLLLHSLATMRELILPALDLAGARRVVEVGGEAGGFTAHLATRARDGGGHVHIVDPAPSSELAEMIEASDELTLVREASPTALTTIGAADAYVLDGDHNYATVRGELAAIAELAGDAHPLVVLHDIGWPWGRRDLYYRPAGEVAYALEEGGPRNGVLTAVEDFLQDHPSFGLVRVPCIFGLGFLFDSRAPYAPDLRALLAPYADNPLLARLEENRIALYLRVHDVLRDLERVAAERDEALAALGELRAAIGSLASSRTVRTADALLLSPHGRLRRVLEDLVREDAPGDSDK